MQENIYSQIKNIGSKWRTNNIFIIGKGPSVDNFSTLNFNDGLVLNINDSEKIIQGDVGIFSANWVRQSLKEHGFGCQYYLAGKPLAEDIAHTLLPPIPFALDDEELVTHRLTQKEFYDESFALSTALKLAIGLGELANVTPNVYVLGFDFSVDQGQISKTLKVDFASGEVDRSLMVHSHESEYMQFAKYLEDNPLINLIHVGEKPYSVLSIQEFKSKFSELIVSKPDPTIQKSLMQGDVLIVAELTNNHLGDVDRLMEMVELAKEAGADLIKIQKRDVDSFYSDEKLNSYYWSPFGKTLRDYRKGVELDEDKLHILDKKCRELNIGWFCSVLDFPSFEIIRKFSPKLIKIPSTISNHVDFHRKLAEKYKGPIVISTGFTDQSYEDYVIKTFGKNEKVYLLHCVSAYPTPLEDCNIAVISHYSQLSKTNPAIVPGYSSHDIGSFSSILAVANGAKMVEKHVKLGDVDWVHFDKVALDLKTDSFKNFVKDIRKTEMAQGSPIKRIMSTEHHKYEVTKKL